MLINVDLIKKDCTSFSTNSYFLTHSPDYIYLNLSMDQKIDIFLGVDHMSAFSLLFFISIALGRFLILERMVSDFANSL